MSDQHIDPYKLNEVLQRIVDGLAHLQEKINSASPEFEILMNNYLTKANEAERNQARFEEALERLELAQQENKKIIAENDELKERIRAFEKDFDHARIEYQREVNYVKEELAKVIQSKSEIEGTLSEKYSRELNDYRVDSERQISQLQREMAEVVATKRKMEDKLQAKTAECDAIDKELNDLRIKLADEQVSIRNEIIEATKRSHTIEQKYQEEKDVLLKRSRQLEQELEDTKTELILKSRELAYKDALLAQTYRQPSTPVPSGIRSSVADVPYTRSEGNSSGGTIKASESEVPYQDATGFIPERIPSFKSDLSDLSHIHHDYAPASVPDAHSFNPQVDENEKDFKPLSSPVAASTNTPKSKGFVGGIWSKLNSKQ
ncbi:MAG: hypothetical protein SFT81_07660 [Candidatus Caenarcaniphilales bacterium]|nr:hypothetical protein [Candidatus Caenarcaniphilales bacterium]